MADDLLRQLIAALHAAYTTPPDEEPLRTASGRLAAYARLRERGFSIRQAARHVGVRPDSGYRYEARLRQQKETASP
jgi:hypothetical protein